MSNSVVIVDEAHNLAGAIESSYASQLTIETLTQSYKHLNQYKTKYGSRLNAKNMMCVKQLLQVILAMGKSLRRFKGEPKTLTTREMIVDAKIDQIDLFKLISYMAQSQVSNKVKGFKMKQEDSVAEIEQSNALKSFLEKKKPSTPPKAPNNSQSVEDFGLAPLLQVRGQKSDFKSESQSLKVDPCSKLKYFSV